MTLNQKDYPLIKINSVESASVSFMKQTYQLFATSLFVAAMGAYLTMPYTETIIQYRWFIFGFELFMLFIGLTITKNKPGLNVMALFIFTFTTGVSLVPIFAMLIGMGKGNIIVNAFLMTAVLFAALSLFAINSKEDYSSWGKALFITLIVVIIGSLVNIFLLQSPIFDVIITAGILFLFSLFTIYDTQNIANGAYDSPVDATISLYLDFLNIFTALLKFLGMFGRDE